MSEGVDDKVESEKETPNKNGSLEKGKKVVSTDENKNPNGGGKNGKVPTSKNEKPISNDEQQQQQQQDKSKTGLQSLLTKFFTFIKGGEGKNWNYLFEKEEAERKKRLELEEQKLRALHQAEIQRRKELREKRKAEQKLKKDAELLIHTEKDKKKREGKEIFPGIYLGSRLVAMNDEWLQATNITHILNVTHEVPFYFPDSSILYHRIPLSDSSDEPIETIFEQAYSFIDTALSSPKPSVDNTNNNNNNNDSDTTLANNDNNSTTTNTLHTPKKVLIHCRQGMSRSPCVLLSYILKAQRVSLREAYLRTFKINDGLRINDGFKKKLMEYEKEILGESTIDFFDKSEREGRRRTKISARENSQLVKSGNWEGLDTEDENAAQKETDEKSEENTEEKMQDEIPDDVEIDEIETTDQILDEIDENENENLTVDELRKIYGEVLINEEELNSELNPEMNGDNVKEESELNGGTTQDKDTNNESLIDIINIDENNNTNHNSNNNHNNHNSSNNDNSNNTENEIIDSFIEINTPKVNKAKKRLRVIESDDEGENNENNSNNSNDDNNNINIQNNNNNNNNNNSNDNHHKIDIDESMDQNIELGKVDDVSVQKVDATTKDSETHPTTKKPSQEKESEETLKNEKKRPLKKSKSNKSEKGNEDVKIIQDKEMTDQKTHEVVNLEENKEEEKEDNDDNTKKTKAEREVKKSKERKPKEDKDKKEKKEDKKESKQKPQAKKSESEEKGEDETKSSKKSKPKPDDNEEKSDKKKISDKDGKPKDKAKEKVKDSTTPKPKGSPANQKNANKKLPTQSNTLMNYFSSNK